MTAADTPSPTGPAATLPTAYGALHAALDVSGNVAVPDRAGIGVWVTADRAHESWHSAAAAWRLTDPRTSILDATDLGIVLQLAQSYDPTQPRPDVIALDALDHRGIDVLTALTQSRSVCAAALTLGMHHSTMQA